MVILYIMITEDTFFWFDQDNVILYLIIVLALITSSVMMLRRNRINTRWIKISSILNVFFFLLAAYILLFNGYKYGIVVKNDRNSENQEVVILGHGGMGAFYKFPKNTLNSINQVLDLQVCGTEVDVQLTKDSVLILYHNEDLNELTNYSGKVYEKNWEELKDCRYFSPFSSNLKIISLEEVFQTPKDLNNTYFSLDCRHAKTVENQQAYYNQFANALCQLTEKYHLDENIIVECQMNHLGFGLVLKRKQFKGTIFLTGNNSKSILNYAKQLNYNGIGLPFHKVSKRDIERAHEMELKVMLWGASSEQDHLEALELEPDFIQSDNLLFALKQLK